MIKTIIKVHQKRQTRINKNYSMNFTSSGKRLNYRLGILFVIIFSCIFQACSPSKTASIAAPKALNLYETLPDAEEKKTLRGILTKEQITMDTAFHWYAENLKFFKPDSAVVQTIRNNTSKINIVIFGGTWCHDTQQLLPKYLSTLAAAGFPDSKLSLIGMDRAKTTVGGLHTAFNITNVPTLLLMHDGKEVGRIVEYGTSGLVDKELGELVNSIH
jgi:hypothetical protein